MASKRRRKSYRVPGTMKRFSQQIHVSKQPNPVVLAEAKARVNSMGWPQWYHDYLDRKYPGIKQDSPQRLAAWRKMQEFAEQLPVERSYVMLKCTWKLIRFFYTDNHEKFFFIEEEYNKRRIRRSINYSAEHRARAAFHTSSIQWKSEYFVPLGG